MLGAMEADADGAGITLADLEIDVAQRRIEGPGIGVGHVGIGRHGAGHGKGHAEERPVGARRSGLGAGEEHHVGDAPGETGRVVAQHKHRAVRAPADHAHRGPNIDGAGQPIAALWNEDDAFAAVRGRLVDRGLDRCAVIGLAVTHRARQLNRAGVIQPGGEGAGSGLGHRGSANPKEQGGGKEQAFHGDRPGKARVS